MGIILGASRHPKDVPFVGEFWWGTYGLGAISPISPWKSPNFGDFTNRVTVGENSKMECKEFGNPVDELH